MWQRKAYLLWTGGVYIQRILPYWPAWEEHLIFIVSQIIYKKPDMFCLAGCKAGYIKYFWCAWFSHFASQKIIGGDMKEVGNPY